MKVAKSGDYRSAEEGFRHDDDDDDDGGFSRRHGPRKTHFQTLRVGA
eukprot:CAMPEP_0171983018 /NCGR_PEP_ID=MMETSP0993-20121228/273061_1 /TAXON_ID=483369 /ORGANISM="non described non described, Strain CCMP2098" /LENGTH=46 /DNA_ID= /DNA_START= /DNA_END= /DNA_ORIENTATION=